MAQRFIDYDDVTQVECSHCEGRLFSIYLRSKDETPVSACATCGAVGELAYAFDLKS